MIRRIALYLAAAAALAAAAGVCVVSLAYAIFALARTWLTPAGSAAIVTLVFAIAIAIVALVIGGQARGGRRKAEVEVSPVDRLIELARQKPLLAAGAAVIGTFMILRNPAAITPLVMGLLAPRPATDRRKR